MDALRHMALRPSRTARPTRKFHSRTLFSIEGPEEPVTALESRFIIPGEVLLQLLELAH